MDGLLGDAFIGGFSYSGQRCTAVKVVLVLDSVADEVVERVTEGVQKLSVGNPEDDCFITPVISKSSADFIEGLIEDAKTKGAECKTVHKRTGNLIYPLVLDKVTADMRIAWEEPFGPVLPFIRVPDVDSAVQHCNKNNVALQGCIFTQNIDRAITLSDRMKTGTVQINAAPARGPDHFPFQGFRDSGIGSQGVQNSLRLMTKIKSTVINLQQPTYSLG